MASEVLAVPEQHLEEFISVVRAGLAAKGDVTPDVREALESWCDQETEYLERCSREG